VRCAGARAHRCLLAAVEEDEAVTEGCSLEHEQRQRGGATEEKIGGGLSSARGSSGERGKGAVRARGARRLLKGARMHRGGVAGVVTEDVNGFNAIEGGARLRGVKEGP
jgi:hypothetical protein